MLFLKRRYFIRNNTSLDRPVKCFKFDIFLMNKKIILQIIIN